MSFPDGPKGKSLNAKQKVAPMRPPDFPGGRHWSGRCEDTPLNGPHPGGPPDTILKAAPARSSRWRVAAHTTIDVFSEPDWRDRLATRLGQRPRRIGPWVELALHGARRCLDQAGEPLLPPLASLRVASLSAAGPATQACLEQCRTGLPLPFSFMQSQPSQLLAALSQHLGWQGDASFVVGRDEPAVRRLAEREAGPEGVLLGWVEEGGTPRCEWWRLVRV